MRKFFLQLNERFQLIIIAAIVGLCGGAGSVALNRSLVIVFEWLHSWRDNWYSFLFPAVGAALSSIFLNQIIRDKSRHGVPEVIYSISQHGGLLRFRSSFSHLVACLLTIASGGSAGPEAPVVISGASIGSNIGTSFRLKDRQRVIVVGCGAAAAIAAIFNAPVTGIVFTLEAILGEWSATNLIPVAIASIVGTEVSRLLQGNQIPFKYHADVISLWNIGACLGLAVITAMGSVVLIRMLRFVQIRSNKIIPIGWLSAAAGGVLVGIIGLYFPAVLGEGYDMIRSIISEHYSASLWILGLTALAKILATSLTIGSGGSGGLFAPCLVIGCFTGQCYHEILNAALPALPWAGGGYFALLGMAGFISGVLQAPMTGVFLVVEITGGYYLLISVVLVAVISMSVSHFFEPVSVYLQEMFASGSIIKPHTDQQILSYLNIKELLEKDCQIIHPEMRLKELVPIIQRCHRNYFPVEDSHSGKFLGMIHLDDIRAYLFDPHLLDTILIEQVMDSGIVRVSPEEELADVFKLFDKMRVWSLPVVQDGKFLGLISKATIMDLYRKELLVNQEE
jgi:CIC family chloride channel protein